MSELTNHKLPKEVKLIYLFSVLFTFFLGLLVASAFFPGDATAIATDYVLILSGILFFLSLGYGILKLIFHSQARNSNDEIHLEELPEYEDDIKNSH